MTKLKKFGLSVGSAISSLALTASTVFAQSGSLGAPINAQKGYADNVGALINAVLTFVMVLAALLVFLYLIWGGIEWITSGGDKGKTESARNKITAAIVGLIILAASYAILQLALNFVGLDITNLNFKTIKEGAN